MKDSKIPQNNNEINNYQKRGFIKNLPFGVKATFIKYWFYGATYFFCFMGFGLILQNENLVIVSGLIGGLLFDFAVDNIFLLFAESREEASKWWFFKSKKFYSMFINIAVVMGMFFAFYYIIVPIKAAMGKNSPFWWLFQEPLSAALLLVSLDTAICWIKNLLIMLFKRIFNKTEEDIKVSQNYINIIEATPVSVTFELKNNSSYLSPKPYNILLNNEIIYKKVTNNVYTIFDLKPDTKYKLSVNKINKEFITPKISKFYKCFEGNDIQNVIDNADQYSLIVVNKGTYLVNTLNLKDNITLYFRKGSIVKPLNNQIKSIFKLSEVKNIKIISEGVIDAESLTDIVYIYNSSNIALIGPQLNNSKTLSTYVFHSYKINLLNLNILNTQIGIKLDRSANINIIGNKISSTKEAILINFKTLKEDDYLYTYKDFELRNLDISKSNNAIVVNGEHHSTVSNINISCSSFSNISEGININSNESNIESTIKDITISYLNMNNVITPFIMNILSTKKTNKKDRLLGDHNKIPYFDNIILKSINVKDYQTCAGYFVGLNEKYLGVINISNSSFTPKVDSKENISSSVKEIDKLCKNGFVARNIRSFKLNNVTLNSIIGNRIDHKEIGELVDN